MDNLKEQADYLITKCEEVCTTREELALLLFNVIQYGAVYLGGLPSSLINSYEYSKEFDKVASVIKDINKALRDNGWNLTREEVYRYG